MSDEVRELRRLLEEERKRAETAEQRLHSTTKELDNTTKDLHNTTKDLHDTTKTLKKTRESLEDAKSTIFQQQILNRPTTIFEYLDTCHTHLFLGLTVGDTKDSTKGALTKPDGRLRPQKITEWLGFADEQEGVWNRLMDIEFVSERHFSSLSFLTELGASLRTETTRSELDLRHFQRDTLSRPVRSLISSLYSNEEVRTRFHLLGEISFENHGNTLNDEPTEDEPPAECPPAKLRKTDKGEATPTTPASNPHPLVDEFCVYNRGNGQNLPAFIVELKPPHKLPLSIIEHSLKNMDLDEVLQCQPNESEKIKSRRTMAAVITQAFSYMIKSGVRYGYVSTGEAFIFLYIGEDPGTVYYYLSQPKKDVGESTGYAGQTDQPNKLHMTAVGQVLAFTLRSLLEPPCPQDWRKRAEDLLKPWQLCYNDDSDITTPSPKSVATEGYTPELRSREDYASRSPVMTRAKKLILLPSQQPHASENDQSSEESDENSNYSPDSPCRGARRSTNVMVVIPPYHPKTSPRTRPFSEGRSRPYCTPQCLLGLLNGGNLDKACPNVNDHGTDKHQINISTFLSLLHDQLLIKEERPLDLYASDGCESLHIHGSRGALFEVILFAYGYKLVGKGFPAWFLRYLQHERAIYQHLLPVQGRHVPVCLGTLDLSKLPLSYDGIAEIPQVLLLSFAGISLRRSGIDRKKLSKMASESLQAIHRLGVRHCDPYVRNIFWNVDSKRVVFIDFERAQIQEARPPLQVTSFNAKRKRVDAEELAKERRAAWMLEDEMHSMLMDIPYV
ncbi:hypothetical protein LOZ12_004040 [Ophidiomyces ophidiicola]|nr:hypothetical protein LOZ62_005217 [Ophidiomyces ophidiicola]KAI2055241.1 hypothetical protein LOZ38_000840 [Ophidiomyces ophidiicola]KAI2070245.1 hypothetical protein LOZ39_005076 [Ophidiomyces ophidiicola]KAI2075507.1 hypothetical protein LOZ37_003532 [Ophidiomyces ophidiicola]KAI2096228.1 hypothetical protein LOZ35_002768 [Ophidiomyces ophidiicola]